MKIVFSKLNCSLLIGFFDVQFYECCLQAIRYFTADSVIIYFLFLQQMDNPFQSLVIFRLTVNISININSIFLHPGDFDTAHV